MCVCGIALIALVVMIIRGLLAERAEDRLEEAKRRSPVMGSGTRSSSSESSKQYESDVYSSYSPVDSSSFYYTSSSSSSYE